MKRPQLLGFYASPGRLLGIFLSALPFVLFLIMYFNASSARLEENPQDKILPSLTQMLDAVDRVAFQEDRRSGEYILWSDTFASLKRIGIGISLAAFCGLFLGLNMGIYPGFRSLFLSFMTFFSIIPPLAILPILFISFGVDEFGKIALIFLGTFPLITRDIYLSSSKIPFEQIIKSLTLGARSWQVTYRIILPQILPRLIETVRLALGAAWLFLIASEAISSQEGLGYRIFLVRRYLAMDVIIPYALWITFLGFLFDYSLRKSIDIFFPWYKGVQ
ncbi:ABC transporter permease [Pseudobacteriovorax antillogorgiicola]|uniref:NitT/TauT family transport system permease protein n=1 Tax=Pseudobacteriovorax antillogorgiicola TaxID=1513793 RepID=A0A1Y6CD81_9BACT|nr:ABC transporter permease subunit [Pseudobacteriovorax antillogorgiicola]TCS48229.1 NitT/TauT family transport system permease protein [Pseudobacteriovorax antillogorgiicola]SMF57329.1 NitT/TauT family transport system permease protein [Pseudobacteriovorax antillogorgiicola]